MSLLSELKILTEKEVMHMTPVFSSLLFRPVMVVRAAITPHLFPPRPSSVIRRSAGRPEGTNRTVRPRGRSAAPPGGELLDLLYVMILFLFYCEGATLDENMDV